MKQQDQLIQLLKKFPTKPPPLPKIPKRSKPPAAPKPGQPLGPLIEAKPAVTEPPTIPDHKIIRRQCPSCHKFIGPAAVYCEGCGRNLEKGTRSKPIIWFIVIITLIFGAYLFISNDHSGSDLTADLDGFLNDLHKEVVVLVEELSSETQEKKTPPQAAAPPQKPAPSRSSSAVKPATKPTTPPASTSEAAKDRITKEGFFASLAKDSILEADRLTKAEDTAALQKMRDKREIFKLKAGLSVVIEDSGPGWAKVRMKDKDTTFFTTPEALGR
ncbi:MAG: hypothetical protein HQK55_12045 [Deltaproteobacteria bacterium]|nr:hypothetical protein [Deltaproteobacteria bacterium]